jgi:hypothetical protein
MKGGRPRGSVGSGSWQHSHAELRELTKRFKTPPIVVMMENMEFHHRESVRLLQTLRELQVQVDNPESVREMCQVIALMQMHRDKAQACAVQAAPYMHPRLASIQVANDPEPAKPVTITDEMDVRQVAEEYRRLLAQA